MTRCIKCTKEYIKHRSNSGSYCSKQCYWDSMKGKAPLGGKLAGSRKGHPLSEAGKRKMSLIMRTATNKGAFKKGELHRRWIQDRELIKKYKDSFERNSPLYKRWRGNVWKRDNYKCRIADNNCNGKLEAHHILPWRDFVELRYKINNGITLCHAHHPRARAEEKRLIPTFQELVSVSN